MSKGPRAEELAKAIRAHCMDCSGGSRKDVHNCKCTNCNLYPYRKGEQKKREKKIKGQMTIFDFIKQGGINSEPRKAVQAESCPGST